MTTPAIILGLLAAPLLLVRKGKMVATRLLVPRVIAWSQNRVSIQTNVESASDRLLGQKDAKSMQVLFLHGWTSVPGGLKPTYLKQHGHEVINPALPEDDFDESVRTAQAEYDLHQPEVIVGSSRGGAVAVNMNSRDTPLVLLCPAWKNWGTATTVKPQTIILHSRQDEVIPFADSEELLANSGLPPETLIEVGDDHRLADPEPLGKMLEACERLASGDSRDE